MNHSLRRWAFIVIAFASICSGAFAAPNDAFARGVTAYRAGDYATAAEQFRTNNPARPAVGTLVNLGLAEWQRGRVGPAVLAWEQARWMSPGNRSAAANLAYARQLTGSAPPDHSWYERAATWLPPNAWAALAVGSFWLAVGLLVLPAARRWRLHAWPQAVTALACAVFLLTLPPLRGVMTRAQLGVVLPKHAPLRLTPTAEAEVLLKLAAGDVVREVRRRGDYLLVRTADGQGWILRSEFGRICPE